MQTNQQSQTSRAFQYQFDLQIQKVKILKPIEVPPTSYMQVIWRRGQNNITTKTKVQVKGYEDDIQFNQKLSMISTCLLNLGNDNNNNKFFNAKESIVSVIININGSQKLFGSLSIDLSQALNAYSHRQGGFKMYEEELGGRTKSKIYLKLSSTYLKEMMKGDQQSVGSSNNYQNTSNYSIGLSGPSSNLNTIPHTDKKLNEIPSKDTYSVVSYGGSVRYSYRKDDPVQPPLKRQDSNPKNQQKTSSYGLYTTNNNYYSKTMNQYNLTRQPSSSITSAVTNMNQTSTSVMRPSRTSQSDHNRSSITGQQNSRLLNEQQNKRSKLQAENTKSKVENTELKNKLNQYVRENMRLKDQLRKVGKERDEAVEDGEKQELRGKNMKLMQEIRDIKANFDRYYTIQRQYNTLKLQNSSQQQKIQQQKTALQKLTNQLHQLKQDLTHSKTTESTAINQLRQLKAQKHQLLQSYKDNQTTKIKQLQKQLSQNKQKNTNLLTNIQQKQSQLRNRDKDIQSMENMLKQRQEANKKILEQYHEKEVELRSLYNQYGQKIKENTSYSGEVQRMRAEIGKIGKERGEWDVEVGRLKGQLVVEGQKNRDLMAKNAALASEKSSLQNNYRLRQGQRIRELQKAKNDIRAQKQLQINRLKQQTQKYRSEIQTIQKQLTQKKTKITTNHTQNQSLMKQNLQIELQLKYKTDQLHKYTKIEQQYQNLHHNKTMLENDYKEIQQQKQKLQKQLRDKNRAYMLECEKNRMLNDDKIQINRGYLQLKEELQHARIIINNGDKQVKEMDHFIYQLECRNNQLEKEIKKVDGNQEIVRKHGEEIGKLQREISGLEKRNKELESRNNQKLFTLENLNKNLTMAKNQIKQLQAVSEERHIEIINRENYIIQQDNKIKEYQLKIAQISEQASKQQQEKKSLNKKVEMLMEELFLYKKKFEEEKTRINSSMHVRSSEDYLKMRNLENQLQKKEERISKLQKEVIMLEDENVKLNIEIMKKLEEMKVNGSNGSSGNIGSITTIN